MSGPSRAAKCALPEESYGRTAARQSAQGMRESRRRVPRTLHPAAAPAMLAREAAMSSSLAAHDPAYEVRAFNTAAASENKITTMRSRAGSGFVERWCPAWKCTPTWRTCRSRAGVAPGSKAALAGTLDAERKAAAFLAGHPDSGAVINGFQKPAVRGARHRLRRGACCTTLSPRRSPSFVKAVPRPK
jgi:hypothetical protein